MTRTTIGDAGVTVEQQPDGRWRWYDGKSWKTCRYGKMNLPTRAEAYADAQWVLGQTYGLCRARRERNDD